MSARVYAALLAVLPARFRREYGDLMLEAYRAMQRDRAGSRARLWLLAGRDLASTAGREWRTEMESSAMSLLARRLFMGLAGLALIAGAGGWFVLFIGPQWGIEDLGWGRNGSGYKPWAIVLASLLFAGGLAVHTLRERGSVSRLWLAGLGALVVTALLMAAQAPVPMGGVSFDSSGSTPARGMAVHLLPLAVTLLALEWGLRGANRHDRWRTAVRVAPAAVIGAVAVALLFPPQTAWFDLWDFVFRYAFIFPALWVALRAGYGMLGGPDLEVRLVRSRPGHASA